MGLCRQRRRARKAPKSRSAMKLMTDTAEIPAIASALRPESGVAEEEDEGELVKVVLLVLVVEAGRSEVLVEGVAEDCFATEVVAVRELFLGELWVGEAVELAIGVEELRVLVRVLVRVKNVSRERGLIVVSEDIVLLVTIAVAGTTAGGAAFVAIGTKLPPYRVL
jgi:hypothetical protein